jgi:hypothetical protein
MSLEMILENKRDSYLIQVLEEGTTELESLKTKKYLTENLETIRKILIEEGLLDTLKNHGGKIAAGIGLGAAATYAGTHEHALDDAKEAIGNGVDKVKKMYSDATDNKPEITPTKLNDHDYVKSLNLDSEEKLDQAIKDGKVHSGNAEVQALRKSFHTPIPSNGPVTTSGIEKDVQTSLDKNDPTHIKSTREIVDNVSPSYNLPKINFADIKLPKQG